MKKKVLCSQRHNKLNEIRQSSLQGYNKITKNTQNVFIANAEYKKIKIKK